VILTVGLTVLTPNREPHSKMAYGFFSYIGAAARGPAEYFTDTGVVQSYLAYYRQPP
jgi:hypothetical protein